MEKKSQLQTAELLKANKRLSKEIAERKRAEEGLQAERQRLYNVLEALPVYVVLLDKDYRVPFANKFFRERFGESHGKRCYEYLFKRSEACENCETYKVMKSRASHHWEWTGPDGRNYDIYDFPFIDTNGSMMILEMGIDITEAKRAEAALKKHQEHLEELVKERTADLLKSEGRFRALIENAADVIAIIDSKGLISYISPNICAILGYSQQEMEGRDGFNFIHPDDMARCQKALEEVIRKPDVLQHIEARGHHKSGSWRWLHIVGQNLLVDPAVNGISINIADITERKQVEQTLRESEQRLKRSQEIAHLGSWELDVVNNQLFWSDEAYRIFGLKPQEFKATYEAFLERVHPDDRKAVDRAYSGSIREGRDTYEIEHRVIRKQTGEIRYVHEKCEHIRDSSGKIIRSMGMVHDITDAKKATETIEKLSRFPLENPSPVMRIARDCRLLFANKASEQLLKEWKCAIGQIVPGDWCKRVVSALRKGVKQEIEIGYGNRVFLFSLTPIKEGGYVNLYALDITERRKAEQELAKLNLELEEKVSERTSQLIKSNEELADQIQERLEIEKNIRHSYAILKLITVKPSRKEFLGALVKLLKGWTKCRYVGIRVTNEEGRIPYEAYAGFSEEFIRKESNLSLQHDNCVCVRAIMNKKSQFDKPLLTKFGSFYSNDALNFLRRLKKQEKKSFRGVCMESGFSSVAVIPVRYKGNIIAAIHLADERKDMLPPQTVAFVERINLLIGEGLQKFILTKKKQVAEEQLLTAEKELNEARRLSDIGTLAATVAHELRNPLGVIRMASYNIKRKAPGPELSGHLNNIEKKILESEQIINNLLYYSRIKMPHFEETKIYEVLEECINQSKAKFHKDKINFKRSYNWIKKDSISADPVQLKEVFNNILNNACEATSGRQGKIEVSAGYSSDKNYLKVSIKDNGSGIAPEDMEKLSKPFFTTKAKGTGLGLTVSYHIIGLHAGTINVESNKGQGTSFTVSLPARREANAG
ncbi:MAG: PAS domain S-box protein [Candidatus Omnitrophota bacterium]